MYWAEGLKSRVSVTLNTISICELPCWSLVGLLNSEIKCSNYIPNRFHQLPSPVLVRNYADHPTCSTTSNATLKNEIQPKKENSHLIACGQHMQQSALAMTKWFFCFVLR